MKIALLPAEQFPGVYIDKYLYRDRKTDWFDEDIFTQIASENYTEDIEIYITERRAQKHPISDIFTLIACVKNENVNIFIKVYNPDKNEYKTLEVKRSQTPALLPLPVDEKDEELPPTVERTHVGAIIRDRYDRVLVEDHIKKDGLVFPGGKVDKAHGETLTRALARELKEELGITNIKFGTESCKFRGTGEYPAGSGNMITWDSILYNVESYEGKITNMEPNKCRSIQWMNEDDLVKHPRLKERYYIDGPGKHYRDFVLNIGRIKI